MENPINVDVPVVKKEIHVPIIDVVLEINKDIVTNIAQNPLSRILNLQELTVENIEEYLESLHTTLWSNWIITDKNSRKEAAKWLLAQINAFYDFAASQAAGGS